MFFEMVFLLYMLIGLLVWIKHKDSVTEHVDQVATNLFIGKIMHVIAFLVTIFFWPSVIVID